MALVLALMTMIVLTILATTAIYYTTQNQHQSSYSKASDAAYRLAETGINNAVATLNGPSIDVTKQAALPSTEASASHQLYAGVGPGATAKWWATLGSTPAPLPGFAPIPTWTIYGKGSVPSPVANSSAVTRTVSASVAVTNTFDPVLNAKAWNFIYLSDTTGAPSGGCDSTLDRGAVLDAPLFLEGNLCLLGDADIVEGLTTPRVPISVTVRGSVFFANSSTRIGVSPSDTISTVTIGGGCFGIQSPLKALHTCIPASATSDYSKYDPLFVGAGGFSTSVPTVTPPVMALTDWATKYATASPGPTHPCTTVTGTPPLFDGGLLPLSNSNNTQQNLTAPYPNGSIPDDSHPQNLTPGTSYTCETSTGKLDWNASTHTMTIAGAVYIDGGVTIGSKAFATSYDGLASLYVSGAIQIIGSVCAVLTAGVCDLANWNPNTEMWVLAAHGTSSQSSALHSILLSDIANFQGALFATAKVILDSSAIAEGPMIAGSVSVVGNATVRPFPLITSMPLDAPTIPNNTHAQAGQPTNFSG
jgi:Tfp pilus assembly protein PilX